jgi:hypothetical protein
VDACAGAGADDEGTPGSPLIALEEGERAAAQISATKGTRKAVELVCIERSKGRLKKLRARVGDRGGVTFIQGTLADAIDRFVADGAKIPHLYFIDPFGLSPLRAETIKKALSGPHNEVFLLFAGPAIRRHFGSYLSIQDELDAEQDLFGFVEVGPNPQEEEAEAARQRGAEASEKILDTAFGHREWKEILKLPQRRRLEAAVGMYRDLLMELGATHVLPMPILDGNGNLKYHLIYATKSPRGYEVMKDALERGLNEGIVGKEEQMHFGSTISSHEVERLVRQHFAGKEVPWSATEEGQTVKGFALQETPASVRQVNELKERLKELKVSGRGVQRYRFPPL